MALSWKTTAFEDIKGTTLRIRHVSSDHARTASAEAPLGTLLWPAGHLLARFLARCAPDAVRERTVLELGSGTGLAGLTAAALGARHVLLTDAGSESVVLDNLRWNEEENRKRAVLTAPVTVMPLTWASFSASVLAMPPVDVVLAADCLYRSADYEDLMATLAFLLDERPDAVCYAVVQERNADREGELDRQAAAFGLHAAIHPSSATVADWFPDAEVHSLRLYTLSAAR